MDINEFIHEFDVLLNAHQQEFDGEISELLLDEYEKSVFLTQAQEEFVVAAYNGKNQYGYMFESDEESRRYLAPLIKTVELSPLSSDIQLPKISPYSKFFKLPKDVLFITYESVTIESDNQCFNGKTLEVVPVKQDEFHSMKNNPYRGLNKRRALRLDNAKDTIEIVCKHNISKYTVRYVKKPSPIVLTCLDGDLSIQGVDYVNGSVLEPVTHRLILQRAVSLALQSKSINQKTNKQIINNNQNQNN